MNQLEILDEWIEKSNELKNVRNRLERWPTDHKLLREEQILKERIKELEDLKNSTMSCPNCDGGELVRFGSRKQVNFKCNNRDCGSFFSEDKLKDMGVL